MSQKLQEILYGINPSLAELTQDIEKLLFVSPRAAMQTTRTMAETLVRQVAQLEGLEHNEFNFGELQMKLKNEGIVTPTTDNAIHFVRKQGNIASHDGTRKMLIREALTCWEYQHLILTWFIETYASPDIEVPEYIEPVPEKSAADSEYLIEHIEALMQTFVQKQPTSENVVTEQKVSRRIYYKDQFVEIPDFLRDAFLLPQRFPKSTTFLIRLNGEQQARIMSELPYQLEGMHQHVKRFKEANDECLFEEVRLFVEEEQKRKILMEQYRGEVLLFYKSDFAILTEALGNVALTKDNFPGQTSLLTSLQEQGFSHVKDFPKELVLLGKYRNVGETALANLFNQLKVKGMEFTKVEI
ncbi:DUF4145 domain-containing protein [Lysinibacillus mangiferihumi]|uniref:DUF4145 domain-containing protein n=1 Tax=Lysinibacillus mangiferihumi TaxID=1130819 RepID=A0A4U2Z397_9BACI|nr:DUF4145 domain-containing protein [Lysinibacillus mangiferihumi]TKI67930.1 DUF4145 domain-containing protein [Lysinibacillus mangiferihumi]